MNKRNSGFVMLLILGAFALIIASVSIQRHNVVESIDDMPMADYSPEIKTAEAIPCVTAIPSQEPEPAPEAEPAPTPEPVSVYTELGDFTTYAYCPCVKCCGIWSAEHESRLSTDYIQKTASGTIPQAGRTIAVDPSVIPLGATVYIDGLDYVAEDKSGAIKGNTVDIFFATHQEALNYGIQNKKIYIYEGENE